MFDLTQLQLLSHRQLVLYALKAAKLVEHLTTLPQAKEAVATVERWLEGKATAEECKVAASAAADAAWAADAANAANAAANAAYAAANAAYAAANAANAAYAANSAAYAARVAITDPPIERQLIDYYQYLLTMSERVWKMLEE